MTHSIALLASFAAGAIAIASDGASAARAMPTEASAPCVVADQIITQFVQRSAATTKVFVASQPITGGAAEFPGDGWRGSTPPKELIEAYVSESRPSVLDACPNVTAHLDRLGVKYGDDAVRVEQDAEDKRAAAPIVTYGFQVLTVSFPAVSVDGNSAIVETAVSCGMTCGAGSTDYYVQERGAWRVVGTSGRWIG